MTVYETTNHNTIYHWCTSRGLWPACVAGNPDRIRLGGDEFSPGDVARKETNDFAKTCGAHFLSKPFSVSELTKAVQKLAS